MPILNVDNVSKTYVLDEGGRPSLGTLFGLSPRRPKRTKAVDGVTLRVERGESTAIIGRNGSGKSTLLKLVAGLAQPSSGSIQVHGTIGTLIDLGVGFHPEHTGRENIRFAGQLNGLSRAQIDDLEPSITEFSGLAEYIDRPLKTYSSGMAVRLGFSVATAFAPDILIIDEVLAVGDAAFQFRCYERMEQYLIDGGTILFVSHSMGSVLRMCPRAIWLDNGVMRADGDSMEVSRAYDEAFADKAQINGQADISEAMKGTGEATIREVLFFADGATKPTSKLWSGQSFRVRVSFDVASKLPTVSIAVALYRTDGLVLLQQVSSLDGLELTDLAPGEHTVELRCERLLVEPCDATVSVALMPEIDPRGGAPRKRYDLRSRAWSLQVVSDAAPSQGAFQHPCEWRVT